MVGFQYQLKSGAFPLIALMAFHVHCISVTLGLILSSSSFFWGGTTWVVSPGPLATTETRVTSTQVQSRPLSSWCLMREGDPTRTEAAPRDSRAWPAGAGHVSPREFGPSGLFGVKASVVDPSSSVGLFCGEGAPSWAAQTRNSKGNQKPGTLGVPEITHKHTHTHLDVSVGPTLWRGM